MLWSGVFFTIFVFSTVLWIYEVGVSYFVPQYLAYPLTHYDFFPLNLRNDLVGVVAFAVSIFMFFMWYLTFGFTLHPRHH